MTDEREIFDYYISKGLVQHRRFDVFEAKIRARLKHYTVADLKLCIDHMASSRWHRDNGQTHLSLIVRSDERVEFWLARKPRGYQEAQGKHAGRKPDVEA